MVLVSTYSVDKSETGAHLVHAMNKHQRLAALRRENADGFPKLLHTGRVGASFLRWVEPVDRSDDAPWIVAADVIRICGVDRKTAEISMRNDLHQMIVEGAVRLRSVGEATNKKFGLLVPALIGDRAFSAFRESGRPGCAMVWAKYLSEKPVARGLFAEFRYNVSQPAERRLAMTGS